MMTRTTQKDDGVTKAVYVGNLLEKRGSDEFRYIYMGATRVAVLKGAGAPTYFHGDHLGLGNIITHVVPVDTDAQMETICEGE